MNTITVKMNEESLYDFLLFHVYSKFSGFLVNILGLAVAVMGILLYITGRTSAVGAALYIGASVLFLGANPLQLKLRARKLCRTNPDYSEPVQFTFNEETGITVNEGEQKQNYSWDMIQRAVVTPKTIGLYFEVERALIIPKADFGSQFADIFQMIAQNLGMQRMRMR